MFPIKHMPRKTDLFTTKLDSFRKLSDMFASLFEDRKLVGDAEANRLKGGWGNDLIVGNAGNDTLIGSLGDDFMLGNTGDDCLWGGMGNDVLHGGVGDDHLFGGSGDDLLSGDRGNDFLCGGAGRDTFEFNVLPAFFGQGTDIVADFCIGVDKIAIRNGDISKVSFVDLGNDIAVYYEGWNIAILKGIKDIPADTSVFFG